MADGIQIGNDHERMAEVSANALVQETESSSIQIGVDHERMAEIIDLDEVLDLVQEQTEKSHRNELVKCICENDEVARREASKYTKELFIEKVLNHTGEPQKQRTV